jgi:hypothetical protein
VRGVYPDDDWFGRESTVEELASSEEERTLKWEAVLLLGSEDVPRELIARIPSYRGPTKSDEPPTPGKAPASQKPVPKVPLLWFLLALSYAGAVTIFLVLQLVLSPAPDSEQLESLPDVVPKIDPKTERVAPVFVPIEAELPRGHTLRLGDSRRFGSLVVTPLRVTRGPLEFAHFNDASRSRPAAGPVLKLWLRFENVSRDQVFPPLCRQLVFNRHVTQYDRDRELANNFVCRKSEKARGGEVVLPYDLVIDDVWDLKDQQIDRVLKPDETFETYIPTTEDGIEQLAGRLVWRVHFRKGYHPETYHGVTTLIEVEFDAGEIQNG